MKVAGISMMDPWASRVLRAKGVETVQVTGAPVETVVYMERVAIEHHGQERNYRPLLHLTGELRSIIPDEALPFGVQEVTFRESLGPVVDAYYEFDDAQLAELVTKGYFTEGFEPPSTMAGIPWDLPTTIDALILAPEHEGDTPVVFVTVHGQTELALDAENSGYKLAEYFENRLTPELAEERELHSAAQAVPTHSGEFRDLFEGEEFTAPDPQHISGGARGSDAAEGFPVVRSKIFEELLAEFRNKLPAEPDPVSEQEEAPVEATPEPDDMAELYQRRIVPGVDRALSLPGDGPDSPDQSGVQGPDTESPAFEALDLSEPEDELGVAPLTIAPAAEESWQPDASVSTGSDSERTQGRRRVQRSQAHERALAMDAPDSEQELG
ncbi:hypothetical protein [Arthrobacter koreensis]|uniref:hypothetical protein n=1 Tax=Arthrobacter koreensis TaxID=199136 RepID=UPI003801DDC6